MGFPFWKKDTTPKCSAVLIKYERHEERKKIVEDLKRYEFIDDIVIHDNTKENLRMYGRYHATSQAKHDLIYVQDDDCIVHNLWQIYSVFVHAKCDTLVNGMKPERMPFYRGSDTLMGWGAFFNRRWLFCLQPYIDKFGKDYIFHRECDRIFTTMMNPIRRRITVPAIILDFPSAMSSTSLSLQAEHEQTRALAVHRCEEIINDYRK